jgi:hypothetical protein
MQVSLTWSDAAKKGTRYIHIATKSKEWKRMVVERRENVYEGLSG